MSSHVKKEEKEHNLQGVRAYVASHTRVTTNAHTHAATCTDHRLKMIFVGLGEKSLPLSS